MTTASCSAKPQGSDAKRGPTAAAYRRILRGMLLCVIVSSRLRVGSATPRASRAFTQASRSISRAQPRQETLCVSSQIVLLSCACLGAQAGRPVSCRSGTNNSAWCRTKKDTTPSEACKQSTLCSRSTHAGYAASFADRALMALSTCEDNDDGRDGSELEAIDGVETATRTSLIMGPSGLRKATPAYPRSLCAACHISSPKISSVLLGASPGSRGSAAAVATCRARKRR